MDNELFELCKEVERVTGWLAPDTYKAEDGRAENDCQDYTIDYLLTVLPRGVEVRTLKVSGATAKIRGNNRSYMGHYAASSTPLRALLKLTKVLADAGELKV